MPTLVTHVVVPVALGLGLGTRIVSTRLLLLGAMAALLPDLDVIGFRLGIAYSDALGHRGFSHSILLAVVLGLLTASMARPMRSVPLVAFLFVALCAASHGLLDMLTDGGEGIALWWPWSEERLFAPWRVIEASPLSLRRLFGPRGAEVLLSEMVHVWIPAAVAGLSLVLVRKSGLWRRAAVEGKG